MGKLLQCERKVECPSCHKTINLEVTVGRELNRQRKIDGGVHFIPQDYETISAEQSQIDGIIGLAKEDFLIKQCLLKALMENFFDELEVEFRDIFASNGLLKEV